MKKREENEENEEKEGRELFLENIYKYFWRTTSMRHQRDSKV